MELINLETNAKNKYKASGHIKIFADSLEKNSHKKTNRKLFFK
jgi:hypothetical protein